MSDIVTAKEMAEPCRCDEQDWRPLRPPTTWDGKCAECWADLARRLWDEREALAKSNVAAAQLATSAPVVRLRFGGLRFEEVDGE